mmetsp:Transcript_28795/g.58477  ORF Transcript_28795/g.58477 Transcript_28795/m.58477 type:complete len:316 (-) Transcript_28795:314-1261(-)|eukprot:CAMPEP_0178570996 /NCGR_PEP_ID=MMETSP0697-20121206/17377_1 /TAXON_ID=265572 /ORGANISM="Extubocellulus spinifer, Strain CCMP396" /LENGTH=315 /DNA_ID=CAMNT_0020205475 /DNA_START=112 /DNA_END=1059 /DNA_ORIENTATION=-
MKISTAGIVALRLGTSSAFVPASTGACTRMPSSTSLASATTSTCRDSEDVPTRRDVLLSVTATAAAALILAPTQASADAAAIQDSLDVDSFLRTGMDLGGNMGVSSQAGKSRPQTGVVLRDGSDVSRDSRTGSVLAEILTGTKANPTAVVVSFASPWKLETGPVFDVETRDGRTGDGAFLAVTKSTGGKSLADLPSSFFLERLFDPTGRFSFYGPPTDVKVKSSKVEGNRRYIELSFSNLSQSTNAEIPRKALLVATIPDGSENAVMLVGSANASRWKKGSEESVRETVESFRAVPAPKSGLKLRAKERAQSIDF